MNFKLFQVRTMTRFFALIFSMIQAVQILPAPSQHLNWLETAISIWFYPIHTWACVCAASSFIARCSWRSFMCLTFSIVSLQKTGNARCLLFDVNAISIKTLIQERDSLTAFSGRVVLLPERERGVSMALEITDKIYSNRDSICTFRLQSGQDRGLT